MISNVSRILLVKLISYLLEQGVDVENIIGGLKIDYEDLISGTIKLSEEDAEFLWSEGVYVTKDNVLAFNFGLSIGVDSLGVLGTIFQNSSTAKAVLENACQFHGIATDSFSIDYETTEKNMIIEIIPNQVQQKEYPVRTGQNSLLGLALIVKTYKTLTLNELKIDKLILPKCLMNDNRIGRILDVVPTYSSDNRYVIHTHTKHFKRIVPSADYKIMAMMIEYVKSELLIDSSHWSTQVEKILVENYSHGFLSLESVSAMMNQSTRSLQRKLKDEGSSFLELKDKIRFSISKIHLNNYLNVSQTAYFMGFSSVSSFSKAFKKWSDGISASEYLNLLKQ